MTRQLNWRQIGNGLLSVGLGLALFGKVAVASAPGERLTEKEFKAGDANGDGQLTLQEFDEYVIGLFSAADVNNDKVLDIAEAGKVDQREFAKLDLNMDQALSFQEVMRTAHVHFRSADKNQDKQVSATEVLQFGN